MCKNIKNLIIFHTLASYEKNLRFFTNYIRLNKKYQIQLIWEFGSDISLKSISNRSFLWQLYDIVIRYGQIPSAKQTDLDI